MNLENNSESVRLSNALAIWALVFSVLCSLVGLILGIIGLSKYPKSSNGRTMCIIAIVVSVLFMLGAVAWRGY